MNRIEKIEEDYQQMIPIDAIPDGFLAAEVPGLGIVAHNQHACRLLDRSPAALAGSSLDEIFGDQLSFSAAAPLREKTLQYSLTTRGGATRRLSLVMTPHAADDGDRLHLFIRDISPGSGSGIHLEKELRHRQLLLQEMNHRIKNNLATIAGLIKLKSAQLGDVQLLANLAGQIDAVRLVHEELSEQREGLSIHLLPYLRRILESACSANRCDDVKIVYAIPDIRLDAKTAATLGLIVNEIASNTGKYAFPKGWEGERRMEMTLSTEGREKGSDWTLRAAHSGPPIGPAEPAGSAGGLGMELITALAAELGGAFYLERDGAPCYTIEFPAPQASQATGS